MSAVRAPGPTTILTASGIYVDPLDLRIDDVRIEDIAHALGNQCRYSGHTRCFYSVADHSVRVARFVRGAGASVDEQLWALLHDAAEAYLVDLPRPLKRHSEMGELYRRAEEAASAVICERFGLVAEEPQIVKHADLVMLATERRDLMPPTDHVWRTTAGIDPLLETIRPKTPEHSRESMLIEFESLIAVRASR